MKILTVAALNDIRTNAIEGGSAHWMNDDDVCRDVRVKRDDGNVTEITFESDVMGDKWVKYTIDNKSLRDAINKLTGPGHLGFDRNSETVSSLMEATTESWDFDGESSDAIVQVAAFGECVFS